MHSKSIPFKANVENLISLPAGVSIHSVAFSVAVSSVSFISADSPRPYLAKTNSWAVELVNPIKTNDGELIRIYSPTDGVLTFSYYDR